MKFDSELKSHHDLQKNGYKVIRQLHKMECRDGANRAYSTRLGNTYYFIVGCEAFVDIIKNEYPDDTAFGAKCSSFLSYLNSAAKNKSTLSRSIIASFLKAYTSFFNKILVEKRPFVFNQNLRDIWNRNCLMAYIATW